MLAASHYFSPKEFLEFHFPFPFLHVILCAVQLVSYIGVVNEHFDQIDCKFLRPLTHKPAYFLYVPRAYLCPNCQSLINDQRTRNRSIALSYLISPVQPNSECPHLVLTPLFPLYSFLLSPFTNAKLSNIHVVLLTN